MKIRNLFGFIFFIAGVAYAKSQNESRQCGVPENIDKLPDFAQDEIKAVWKDYKPGNKCEKELLITDDILAVLDMFDKEITQASSSSPSTSGTQTTLSELLLSSTPTSSLSTTHEFATATPEAISATDAIKDDTFNSLMPTPEIPTTSDNSQKDYDYFDTKPTKKHQNSHSKNTKFISKDDEDESRERKKIPLYEMENVLPFLEGANKRTILAFHDLLNDPDIPSEGKRQEEIHLLAVSYLDEDQLQRFNEWSTNRRKRLRAREQQLSHHARDALDELINIDDDAQREKVLQKLPRTIQKELRSFALRRKLAAA